jgi:protoporphyrinogen/coproporphyrinogen III oxidase
MTTPHTESSTKKVTIIGAGITGLSAAYTLLQAASKDHRPLEIVLIDAEKKLGGKIITDQVGDLTVEGGPDCFLRQKPWAASLCKELGIAQEIIGTNDHLRKVYVLDQGRLKELPDGVMLIVPTRFMPFITSPLISLPGKMRMGMDVFIPKIANNHDESVGTFVRRRLGQEALDKIAEPLMSGIHVSDPESQSLLATFPRFRNLEQKYGSLIRGMLAERKTASKHAPSPSSTPPTLFLSLRTGMSQLIHALEKALEPIQTLRGNPVENLIPDGEGGYRLELADGTNFKTDVVILAVPSFNAAQLIAPFDHGLAADLNKIRYVSTATITLAYRKEDIKVPFSGFGFVIPRKENRGITACTWSSIKFDHRAPDDVLLLRCFIGGPGKEECVSFADEDIYQIVKDELLSILQLSAKPIFQRIYRWEKANPQYDVGHLYLVDRIFKQSEKHKGLYLTGSAFEGVGIPDCINQGQKSALKALQSF